MEREPIWTLPMANGEQSVLDRVINGLKPTEQIDKRSDEVKAQEIAHAMEMLRKGMIVAINHNPLSLPAVELAAVERGVATFEAPKKKAGRPAKAKAAKAPKAKAIPSTDKTEEE